MAETEAMPVEATAQVVVVAEPRMVGTRTPTPVEVRERTAVLADRTL